MDTISVNFCWFDLCESFRTAIQLPPYILLPCWSRFSQGQYALPERINTERLFQSLSVSPMAFSVFLWWTDFSYSEDRQRKFLEPWNRIAIKSADITHVRPMPSRRMRSLFEPQRCSVHPEKSENCPQQQISGTSLFACGESQQICSLITQNFRLIQRKTSANLHSELESPSKTYISSASARWSSLISAAICASAPLNASGAHEKTHFEVNFGNYIRKKHRKLTIQNTQNCEKHISSVQNATSPDSFPILFAIYACGFSMGLSESRPDIAPAFRQVSQVSEKPSDFRHCLRKLCRFSCRSHRLSFIQLRWAVFRLNLFHLYSSNPAIRMSCDRHRGISGVDSFSDVKPDIT